ncbi:MAG: PEGA domain-containing protein [Magnetococcus sp. DMHC-6]
MRVSISIFVIILFSIFSFSGCRDSSAPEKSLLERNGTLQITSIPEEIQIFVDKEPKGTTPLSLSFQVPSSHLIQAQKAGYQPLEKRVWIRNNAPPPLTLTLLPIADQSSFAEKDDHALVVLTEPKEARVEIMNMNQSYSPGLRLPSGRYQLEVSHPGYQTQSGYIEINTHDWIGKVSLLPEEREEEKDVKQSLISDENLKEILYQPVEPVVASTVSEPVAMGSTKEQSPDRSQKIEHLLSQAWHELQAINDPANFKPEIGANVARLLNAVLELDPDNEKAQLGLVLNEARYMIYIAYYSQPDLAIQLEEKIQNLGIPTFRQTFMVQGISRIQLCAGLFSTYEQAAEKMAILTEKLNLKDLSIRFYHN